MHIALPIVSALLFVMVVLWIYTMYRWYKKVDKLKGTISSLEWRWNHRDTALGHDDFRREIRSLERRVTEYDTMFQDVEDMLNSPLDKDDVKKLCSKLFWLHTKGKSTKEMDKVLKEWKSSVTVNQPYRREYTGLVQMQPIRFLHE